MKCVVKKKYFPCPYCTAKGESSFASGDFADMGDDKVGSIMVQISPDLPCGGCDGEGFIEVGSERHYAIKCSSLYNQIDTIFGQGTIESLPEKEFKDFWNRIGKSFESLRKIWLEANKK